MSYNSTYGTVINSVVGILIEERRLKNACREDYNYFIVVRIGVSLLGIHLPQLAIYRLAYSIQTIGAVMELEFRGSEHIHETGCIPCRYGLF